MGGSRYDMVMFICQSVCVRACEGGWESKAKHMHLSSFVLNVYLFTTNLDFVDTKSLSRFQVFCTQCTQCVYRV